MLRRAYKNVYLYIRLKLNPTVIIRFWTIVLLSLDGIRTHTIDILQHQSLSLMSSGLDHLALRYIQLECLDGGGGGKGGSSRFVLTR